MSQFLNFLQEADGPMGGMGGSPMGGMGSPMGGMPPMGGGMGGGLGGPMGGMGGSPMGMGGMGGGMDPLAPQGGMGGGQGSELNLTPSDVWSVLEKLYGDDSEDSSRSEKPNQVDSKVQKKPKHLMGIPD